MKQKYAIIREDESNEIIVREFAELDKDILSLVCEQKYDLEQVTDAMEKGKENLISALRTPNMYPPGAYIREIADTVISLLQSEERSAAELFFDEITFLIREKEKAEEEPEDSPSDIDELLDEDIEDSFDDDDSTINNINSPIKIADDDALEIDDDV